MRAEPNIKEILTKNEIIGLVTPDMEYEEILIKLLGIMSGDYNKILYISIAKPYESLIKSFERDEIDINKFYFIDCVTGTEKDVQSTGNCTFISSPRALDEIQTTIIDVLKNQKIDITLIDSAAHLSTYYEHTDVLQFMHRLMAELLVANCKGILPFPKESADSLRRSIEMFTDTTIYFYLAEMVLQMQILE